MAKFYTRFKFFAVAGLLCGVLNASHADTPLLLQASASRDNSCEITGTVNYLKLVEKSPYADGTPTQMMVSETHISVTVVARRPHAKDAPSDSHCNKSVEANERQVYKLCSSTRPEKGDRIMATEGGSPGSSNITRCLFDVIALPGKKEKSKGPL